ncbi:3'-5'-exoribonuclease [Rhizina undulata]
MTDRRRINGPSEGTTLPVFADELTAPKSQRPVVRRAPDELRKIFLKTSLTPPAKGSAFLELPSPSPTAIKPSTLKLTASVYGPRTLPPSSTFSPRARLTAELKFAPFSTPHKRRGYVRDAVERDLSVQLQNAIVKSIKTSLYPKSSIDVFVTVLDCEGGLEGETENGVEVGLMGVLAGAITCASAAIADAGIECVDLVSGGLAALVRSENSLDSMDVDSDSSAMGKLKLVLDPSPADGYHTYSAAVVGYMAARDELTLIWSKGPIDTPVDRSTLTKPALQALGEKEEEDELDVLLDGAVTTATAVRLVLNEAVKERLLLGIAKMEKLKWRDNEVASDVDML